MARQERNAALLNGALIALGTVAVLDNIFSHWLFRWHRIFPDRALSKYAEIGLFIAGLIMFCLGVYREVKQRKAI